jgi:hypothetical protein
MIGEPSLPLGPVAEAGCGSSLRWEKRGEVSPTNRALPAPRRPPYAPDDPLYLRALSLSAGVEARYARRACAPYRLPASTPVPSEQSGRLEGPIRRTREGE